MSLTTGMTNLEIIFADWLDAMRRGDIDRMVERLAPSVVHQGVRPDLVCPDRDAVIAGLRNGAGRRPDVTAIELIAAGDHVVMSVRGASIGVPADEASDQPRGQATVVFTLRDGRIVRMQDYLTREQALEAVDAARADVWL